MEIEFSESDHRYLVDGVEYPSVTTILEDLYLTPQYYLGTQAKQRGKAVHEAALLYDAGELDESTTDAVVLGYLKGYTAFIRDSGFEITQSERMVCSTKHRFAGRMDRYGTLAGVPAILDLKTGSIPDTAGLQTAAYAIAWQEETSIQCWRRIALRLDSDGTYMVREYEQNNSDSLTFLAALRVWKWKRNQ